MPADPVTVWQEEGHDQPPDVHPGQQQQQQQQRSSRRGRRRSIGNGYRAVMAQDGCDFTPRAFEAVALNLLRNPNITSSHLFRADVLYDSLPSSGGVGGGGSGAGEVGGNGRGGEAGGDRFVSSTQYAGGEVLLGQEDVRPAPAFPSFSVTRSLIRRLVPRNPQLDRHLDQTCHFLHGWDPDDDNGGGGGDGGTQKVLVLSIPHVDTVEQIPWYHPSVRALAYLYTWRPASMGDSQAVASGEEEMGSGSGSGGSGELVVYYQMFESGSQELPKRLQRMALHLITAMYKHGQGSLTGYKKKFHYDLLVPQARTQTTYAALKQRHAKRLCEAWVEVTDPSKHVFEDLAIAAYLIELWRDMYRFPEGACRGIPAEGSRTMTGRTGSTLPEFPGFVDMGCGNGVLTEVLLSEGFPGWGLDARERKTWAVLSASTRARLRELLVMPYPLLNSEPALLPESGHVPPDSSKSSVLGSAISAVTTLLGKSHLSKDQASEAKSNRTTPLRAKEHDGLFAPGTFIISNHADELTAWTPLLASLSRSPFLAIPCCSHNLSGERFRAPSVFTGFTADASAPQYFAREKMAAAKKKHIAIHVPTQEELDEAGHDEREDDLADEDAPRASNKPETGDLKAMSQAARSKQPSAYSSLCDWVAFLADEVGYEVEKDLMRIPSTRNVAIVGRKWVGGAWVSRETDGLESLRVRREIDSDRWDTVMQILTRERAVGKIWVERARKLMSGKDVGQTVHG